MGVRLLVYVKTISIIVELFELVIIFTLLLIDNDFTSVFQVQLSKVLRIKKEKISMLSDLNCQAEKLRSYGQELTFDFQKKYAALVLEIEELNRDLNSKLLSVQHFCQEVSCLSC